MAEYDVVLLPTFAQVEHWRKRQAADSDAGLFSQTVTTFNAWIADLWELHGDGRAIVDSLQRQVIMQAVFEQLGAGEEQIATTFCDGSRADLSVSPGMVTLAAKCARFGAGVPAFESALERACAGTVPEGLVAREAFLLQCIGGYIDMLESAGLVEQGHAAAYLARHAQSVFPSPLRVQIASEQPLTWIQSSFFEACSNLEVDVVSFDLPEVQMLPEGVQLRFGFPSGRYAQAALVADMLRDGLEGSELANPLDPGSTGVAGLTVVACKNPLHMYKELEAELANREIRACVQAQVAFGSTDFGRQFLSLNRAVGADVWSIDDLSDAVQAPFSGFSRDQALVIDKGLRGDRTLERESCLASLRMASDLFSQFEELAQDPEADILLGVFEQIAFKAKGRSDAWRAEQLSAASALRSCTTAARRVGASMAACARVLEDVKVTVSYQGGACSDVSAPQVVVTTMSAAAQMEVGSCSQVIACDLTAEDYPLANRDDAAVTRFAKLGLFPVETALSRARRIFSRLQSLPTERFTCVRPLNDWNGNPTYPAAVLQELVDAYREGAVGDDDLDPVYGLPDALRQDMHQRGEEDLFANSSAREKGAKQSLLNRADPSEVGGIASSARRLVALERRDGEGGALGFSPSPSQVESYLECPYKWFAQSRLKVEELEEGFGPLERGSFRHAVLQRFYTEFAEVGQRKVTPDNLEQARALLLDVAERELAIQGELEPCSNRYVAVTQLEQREQQACIRQLISYLDFEARLLPTFHPAYLEYEIGAEDGVCYAGHPFVGKVDRIDVDDFGRAVIIDYKGSVSKAFAIADKNPLDPGKVQARMYAQAVRRALGLDVVGALYVGVGKSPTWAGAYDGRVLESAHLPGSNCERSRCMPTKASKDELENAPSAHMRAVRSNMDEDAKSKSGTHSSAHQRQRPSRTGGQPGDELKARLSSMLPVRLDVPAYADLSFSEMLDATEQLVADAIARMEAGDVSPAPVGPEVCTYCPVKCCPKRGE